MVSSGLCHAELLSYLIQVILNMIIILYCCHDVATQVVLYDTPRVVK